MQVFHDLSSAAQHGCAGAALCLGNFDGVHAGHQALFAAARALGRAAALTFEPHPGKVLQPKLAPKLITTPERKLELFARYGLDAAVVQRFDLAYSTTSPEAFEAALLDELGAKHLVIGGDFTYGVRRAGTVETLSRAAAARGASVHRIPPVTLGGVVVSSSKVREYVLEGRVEAARDLLLRFFDVDGRVVAGQGRGRKIGFPTANVETANELRPAAGVYAVRARLAGEEAWRPGAANLGVKPTFDGKEATLEAHLLDFDGDLYGRALRLQFVGRLRPEQRFASVDALAQQIQHDVAAARDLIAPLSATEE